MDSIIHIRRCHICGEVNETHDAPVSRCSHCGKFLAPFFFTSDYSQIDPESPLTTYFILGQDQMPYQPLRGLSAYW